MGAGYSTPTAIMRVEEFYVAAAEERLKSMRQINKGWSNIQLGLEHF